MYNAVPVQADVSGLAAAARHKRLNKGKNSILLGAALDVLFGMLPWVVAAALAAVALVAIHQSVSGAPETFQLFNAPVATGALATFASFLLVSRQSANLAKNNAIVGGFGSLSGSCLNVALFVKSQLSSGVSSSVVPLVRQFSPLSPNSHAAYFLQANKPNSSPCPTAILDSTRRLALVWCAALFAMWSSMPGEELRSNPSDCRSAPTIGS